MVVINFALGSTERLRALALCGLLVSAGGARAFAQEEKAPSPPPVTETIEVTASRTAEALIDAPVSMTIVGQKQIETTPADNYADLLRGVPGLNVIQTSARDMTFRARGATGVAENGQLALIDGRSIYLDYYGIIVWDYLPVRIDELKAVEILRGPGSAVWGANALSGVINLRTKSPRELAGGLLTLGYGNRGTRDVGLRWGQVLNDRWSFKISTSFFRQDPWPRDNLLPNGQPFPFGYTYKNEGAREPKADLRADYQPDDQRVIAFKYGYGGTSGIFHSNVGPYAIQRGAHVDYADVDYSQGSLEAQGYWNHLHGDAPNILLGLPFSFEMQTYVGDVTNRRALGQNTLLVYGADVRYNHFDLTVTPNAHTRSEEGAFAEGLINLGKNVAVNLGGRFDHFSTIGTVFSPRTSVIVKATPNQSVRLALSRSYRAPTLVENFLDTPVPNVIFLTNPVQPFFFDSAALGNRNLREESSWGGEIGYTLQVRNAVFTAAVYQNRLRDHVIFFPTEFFSPTDLPPGWTRPPADVPLFAMPKLFTYLNAGRIRESGAELGADINATKEVAVHASYTYQEDPKLTDVSLPITLNRPPRHQAALQAVLTHGAWYGSAGATYTGSAFWADVLDSRFWGSTPSYTFLNAAAGYHFHKTDLEFKGTNLADRRVKEHIFGDIIGRKVTVQVRERF